MVTHTQHAKYTPRTHTYTHTHTGDVVFELYPDKAPLTVEAFKKYADSGLYDGTAFFRYRVSARERARERERSMYIWVCVHTYMN